jgi:hypothetical protein
MSKKGTEEMTIGLNICVPSPGYQLEEAPGALEFSLGSLEIFFV